MKLLSTGLLALLTAAALPNLAYSAPKLSVDEAIAQCRREHGPRMTTGQISQEQLKALIRSCVQAKMKSQRGVK
jgi:hypothetical protein